MYCDTLYIHLNACMYVCIYTHKYNIHKHIFKGLLKACGSQASAFELNENVTGYIYWGKKMYTIVLNHVYESMVLWYWFRWYSVTLQRIQCYYYFVLKCMLLLPCSYMVIPWHFIRKCSAPIRVNCPSPSLNYEKDKISAQNLLPSDWCCWDIREMKQIVVL